jgi:hypothetical protein
MVTIQVAWNHSCDKYPLQVILKANFSSNGMSYQVTSSPALFSRTRGKNTQLYTYALSQSPISPNIWYFGIQSIDSPDIQPSTALYPTISNVTYNFTDYTFSGNCSLTPPSSSPSNSSPCVRGTFNPNDTLSFNITYLSGAGSNNSNSIGSDYLKAVNDQWAFAADPPGVVLLDDTNGSGDEILRTDMTKWNDCTQLKVCANNYTNTHSNGAMVPGAGANTVIPTGLIFIQQIDYAIYCKAGVGTGGELESGIVGVLPPIDNGDSSSDGYTYYTVTIYF